MQEVGRCLIFGGWGGGAGGGDWGLLLISGRIQLPGSPGERSIFGSWGRISLGMKKGRHRGNGRRSVAEVG